MGLEATCKVTHKRKIHNGAEAHIEGDHILIRAANLRLKIMTADLRSVDVKGDSLVLDHPDGPTKLAVGEKPAGRWKNKILNPPSRLDKLGLKPGTTHWSEGEFDGEFRRQLSPAKGKPQMEADLLFYHAKSISGVCEAAEIGKRMSRTSAIWVVFPKGKDSPVNENEVFRVMRAVGLVDNKVCSFNEKLTALKFVVPKAKR